MPHNAAIDPDRLDPARDIVRVIGGSSVENAVGIEEHEISYESGLDAPTVLQTQVVADRPVILWIAFSRVSTCRSRT